MLGRAAGLQPHGDAASRSSAGLLLARLAEVLMAEEITAVSDDGGKALVRERVDAMSEDLRRLLQDAITEKYRARVRA